ncbi:MAG: hypothetical protein FWD57_10905, partial [Polyangiaceae bacterium]|nr:hypothetical protein [Polyangiaceae bacterium]
MQVFIANPVYDVTFKNLLEDNEAAKFVIGSILGCEILSLSPKPTTLTAYKYERLSAYYMDFAAEIVAKGGGVKTAIIEMQKAKKWADIPRFRRYLGGEYARSSDPIVAIYVLCYDILVDSAAFCAYPSFMDLRTGEVLEVRSPFVEQLTHSSYFLQVERIETSVATDLDMVLAAFAQENFVVGSRTIKEFTAHVDSPGMSAVLRVLRRVAADPALRAELENEYRALAHEQAVFGEQDRIIDAQRDLLMEQGKSIAEKDRSLEDKDRSLEEKDRSL